MEFSRHENEQVAISYSRGFLSPETDPMSLASLHWQADTLPLCHLGSPIVKPVLTSIVAAPIYKIFRLKKSVMCIVYGYI